MKSSILGANFKSLNQKVRRKNTGSQGCDKLHKINPIQYTIYNMKYDRLNTYTSMQIYKYTNIYNKIIQYISLYIGIYRYISVYRYIGSRYIGSRYIGNRYRYIVMVVSALRYINLVRNSDGPVQDAFVV